MSTEADPQETLPEDNIRRYADDDDLLKVVRQCLQPLASLKLTVALFAMAIVLVLAGTLAQHRKDIWEVVAQYFRVPFWPTLGFAKMEFQDFLPPSFFPSKPQVSGWFYFPGGTLIGGLMALNLLAAHGLRFKPQATGNRLWGGLGVIAAGILITSVVILSGSNKGGIHESVWGDWSLLWIFMQAGLGLTFLAAAGGFAWLITQKNSETWVLALAALVPAILGATFFYTIIGGSDARLDGPSMRILWQLIKGTAAGLVLLAGCVMVFKKRAGVVLLHAGIGLMMFSEVQVALTAVEGQMWISEGESVNFVRDVRKIELSIVDRTDPKNPKATVVPQHLLLQDGVIANPQLPFDIEVVKFQTNTELRRVAANDKNLATVGAGTELVAKEIRAGTGVDTGGELDLSSAYVKLTSKDGKQNLGTYLVSIWFDSPIHVSLLRKMPIIQFTGPLPQPIEFDGKKLELSLQFKRTYKPYTVRLDDVRKEDYIGTDRPRDYSSYVQLIDPSRQVDRPIRIWMNNPLRFAGETFYQSNFIPDTLTGKEATSLSVVTNGGWMIPYVSCMIVATGLLAHFLQILVRFLNRQQRERKLSEPQFGEDDTLQPTPGAAAASSPQAKAARQIAKQNKQIARRAKQKRKPGQPLVGDDSGPLAWIVPLVVVFVCAMYIGSKARTPGKADDGLNLYAFGQIPIVYQGRQKPIDTLARNSLRVISNKQTFYGRMTDDELRKNWPQITASVQGRWPKLVDDDLKNVKFDVDELIELIRKQTGDDREQITLFVDDLVNVKQPAIRWLLDVIARPDRAEMHKVFRIENLEVLDTLGLPRRDGFRYAVGEFREKQDVLDEQTKMARAVQKANPELMTTYQRKMLELDARIRTFTLLEWSFQLPALPPLPNEEDFRKNPEANMKAFNAFRQAFTVAKQKQDFLQKQSSPPLMVPIAEELQEDKEIAAGWGAERKPWETYATAWLNDFSRQQIFNQPPNLPTLALQDIFVAYSQGNADEFNQEVNSYLNQLASAKDLQLAPVAKTRFEAFFNQFEPFFYSILLYLFAFLLACLSWLFWRRPLNNAASGLIALTLILHTFAIVSRIYISGRPPVTNLYSSAVFIGWGCSVLGLVLEGVFRIGIGNIVSAVAGFATMWIAHLLAGDGDTFTVLQAVLDTQFWLATHVTCITLGYATTYLAGAFGLVYIFRGSILGAPVGAVALLGLATHFMFFSNLEYHLLVGVMLAASAVACMGVFGQSMISNQKPEFSDALRRKLSRMVYGSLCFAILFSFVGTVLGGLWADDSWGRFWGWDPKENGALIIVLWNALVLHARWDGMVKDRGMAVLAIGGNIVTSWSWFGVNELGVGLHSYGFTEGVLMALLIFVISQLVMIGVGCLPKELWWSHRPRNPENVA